MALALNVFKTITKVATTNAVNPNFQWTPNFINQNNDTITVNANNNMNVSVSVTDANGCTTSAGATIVMSTAPTANFTTAAGNNYLIDFTNTSTGGATYFWDFGDGSTSSQFNPSHTYNAAGTWTVTLIVTNADGCTDTLTQNVTSQLVELGELAWMARIYPNPTKQKLHVEMMTSFAANLIIYDATGKIMKTLHSNDSEITIELEFLQSGTYFLQINSELGQETLRFVKE